MEPEEIDKLFRDKLAAMPVLPPADAWNRLQQKMEPPKKERSMWLYAAAASVALLLLAGILFLKTGNDPAGPAVATALQPAPQTGQAQVEKPSVADAPAMAEKTTGLNLATERQPEAPAGQVAVSVPQSSQSKANSPRVASAPRRKPASSGKQVVNSSPDNQPVLAASQAEPVSTPTVGNPSPQAGAAVPAASLASVPATPRMVEVVVTRGPEPDAGEDLTLRDNLSRKGHMLKNIYKQARNLKNGEPVELAALGVDKEKLKEETKELKQKISNVISL